MTSAEPAPGTAAADPVAPPFSPRFLNRTTLGLATLLGLLGWLLLHQFPSRFYGPEWLTGEHGNQLYRAQVLGAGGLPYREVECQYGPLPLYAYAAFAKLFGNTVQTGCAFHLCMSLAVVAAMFRWLSRAARSRGELLLLAGLLGMASLSMTVFFRSPLILSLGANFEYLSFERLWLIGLAAGWRSPRERGWRDVWRIGLFFLLWQFTKFGGGVFGVAGFFAADLAFLSTVGSPEDRRAFVPFWCRTAVAGLGAETFRAALFYTVLPADLATRSLWPLWVMGHYPYDRLDLWVSWRHFAVFIAPIFIPAVVGIMWTAAARWPSFRARAAAWLPPSLWFTAMVPLAFYLGGSVNKIGYFGREWLFFQYAFALVPCLLLLALRLPRSLGLTLALATYATGAAMFMRSAAWQPPPPPLVRFDTQAGPVWDRSDDPEIRIWQAVQAWLDAHPGSKMVAVSGWLGGGWYAARHEQAPLRNTLFVPGVRTPADDQQLRDKLRGIDLLVCWLPDLPGIPRVADRGEKLRRELSRLFPSDLARRILADYSVADTDPKLSEWVMLRWRAND